MDPDPQPIITTITTPTKTAAASPTTILPSFPPPESTYILLPLSQPYETFEIQPRLHLSRFPRDGIPVDINITHVLNMCTEPSVPDPSRRYMQVPILDFDVITPYISGIIAFIEGGLGGDGKGKGGVLVHCEVILLLSPHLFSLPLKTDEQKYCTYSPFFHLKNTEGI